MSSSTADHDRGEGFTIEVPSRFFEVSRALVDREAHHGRTISFLGEVDLTEIDRIRIQAWTRRKVSYTAFVVKAVALALREIPQANRRAFRVGFWPFVGTRFQSFTVQDVAVSVERDVSGAEGLALLEIIRHADETSLDQISSTIQSLNKGDVNSNPQWRESSQVITRFPSWLAVRLLRRPLNSPSRWAEQRGGAVLVSSPPKEGVDAVFGSWSHPIGVAFGLVQPRAVVVDDKVVARPTLILTLNYDRTILTSVIAARLFKRIVAILERPNREIDELKASSGSSHELSRADRPPSRERGPSPEVPKALGGVREAPPTRIDFPTIEPYQIPETEKSMDAPQTRDEFPTLDE